MFESYCLTIYFNSANHNKKDDYMLTNFYLDGVHKDF
jgi:hypothetical protein